MCALSSFTFGKIASSTSDQTPILAGAHWVASCHCRPHAPDRSGYTKASWHFCPATPARRDRRISESPTSVCLAAIPVGLQSRRAEKTRFCFVFEATLYLCLLTKFPYKPETHHPPVRTQIFADLPNRRPFRVFPVPMLFVPILFPPNTVIERISDV